MPGKIIARIREREQAARARNFESWFEDFGKRQVVRPTSIDAEQRASLAAMGYKWEVEHYRKHVLDQRMRVETWSARIKRYIAKLTSPV